MLSAGVVVQAKKKKKKRDKKKREKNLINIGHLSPIISFLRVFFFMLKRLTKIILDFTTISLMCKVFANGPGDRCSILGRVLPKT